MPAVAWWAGVIGDTASTNISEVLDGTSQTILFAESGGRNLKYELGRRATGSTTGFQGSWAAPGNRIQVRGSTKSSSTDVEDAIPGAQGNCAINCTNNGNELYSFHVGGVNILFADGSVQFLRDTVTYNTLSALTGREEGMRVPSTDY
jgi:prepilin-type processing-associated H-X9-DG protein